VKLIAPFAVLVTGLFFCVRPGAAKPDYTRRTSKDCEFCHPPNSRTLNEAGEYYRDHHNSLKGYKPSEHSGGQKQDKPAAAREKSKS
jgi:hypothetical protein